MDHITGANKEMFLWIKRGGSSFSRFKTQEPSPPYLPASPNPFVRGKGAFGPPKQLELCLLFQEVRSACESWQLCQFPLTSQMLAKGNWARTFHARGQTANAKQSKLWTCPVYSPSPGLQSHCKALEPKNIKQEEAHNEISPLFHVYMMMGRKGASFLWAHLTCSQLNINFPLSHQALTVWPPLTDIGSSYLI